MKNWKLRLLGGLLLAVCSLPVLLQAALNSNQAIARVEHALLPQGRDEVILKIWGPLPAGTPVHSLQDLVLTTPAEGYAVYIDDHPAANLSHPVRYAFVESATGSLQTFNNLYPPANEGQYQNVGTAIGDRLMAVTNRIASFPPVKTALPPTRGQRWAVLMNGGLNQSSNHVRYWNDLSNIYQTLAQVYNYPDDHIIVLCSDGLDPAPDQSNGQNSSPDLDGDGDSDINFSCILSNVDLVFSQLAAQMASDDQLFVFTTGPGNSAGGWNAIQYLWNAQILTDTHFEQLLSALPTGITVVCTFEPSFSGGFLDNVAVAPGPVVASSACSYNQYSYAMSNMQYDEYVFHWTAAVNGHDAYGVEVNADYNSDGIITMDEAYRYAEENDAQGENPQYGEYPLGTGATISLWPVAVDPLLMILDQYLDDIGGNNNGQADPGENILMRLTLINLGLTTAMSISGTLSSSDNYVTITQNTAYWPNLAHLQQGVGAPDYLLSISPLCPNGHTVPCELHVTAAGGYSQTLPTSFMVGNPQAAPTGPDAYGYKAWDNHDGGEAHPYAWLEAAPQHGGPGTALNWTNPDDQTQIVNLPFSFRYYGNTFTQISVCTNGWIALGVTTTNDWTNTGIPNLDGPPNMVALFWRDLNAGYGGSQIATWYNAALHYFVVEYDSVAFFAAATSRQTFEAIFYDPVYYPTSTGDGIILAQYKQVSSSSSATFGIENQTETVGLQYGYNGTWDEHASPVTNSSTITYTTNVAGPAPPVDITLTPVNPPLVIPAQGGSFSFYVSVFNNGASMMPLSAWIMQLTPQGLWQGPMLGPVFLNLPPGSALARLRTQTVPSTAPAGVYVYRGYVGIYNTVKWDSSSFTYLKLPSSLGQGPHEWTCTGEPFPGEPSQMAFIPSGLDLEVSPNPFNPVTALSYKLQAASQLRLTIWDTAGRLVATLADGWREAGVHQVRFDGSELAAGVYLFKLEAGRDTEVRKAVLLK